MRSDYRKSDHHFQPVPQLLLASRLEYLFDTTKEPFAISSVIHLGQYVMVSSRRICVVVKFLAVRKRITQRNFFDKYCQPSAVKASKLYTIVNIHRKVLARLKKLGFGTLDRELRDVTLISSTIPPSQIS